MNIIGDVEAGPASSSTISSFGGTLCNAAEALTENGAAGLCLYHPWRAFGQGGGAHPASRSRKW